METGSAGGGNVCGNGKIKNRDMWVGGGVLRVELGCVGGEVRDGKKN